MSGRRLWFHAGSGPCALCGSPTLRAWSSLHGFPTADGGLPYSLDGSTVAGTTIYGDITSDGTSFGRAGSGSTGPPLVADNAIIVFPVVAKDFSISYEYKIASGGKHWTQVMADYADVDSASIGFGSWSTNFSNTRARIGAWTHQTGSPCQDEYEPPELAGLWPQTAGVWRTRTMSKAGRTITFTDGGVGPIALTRCYFPARGHVALCLGPGVRIKNLTIS